MMMWPFPVFAGAVLALGVERLFGYPSFLYRLMGHPVEWMGRLLTKLENFFLDPTRSSPELRLRGVVSLGIFISIIGCLAACMAYCLSYFSWGWVIEALIASSLLAQKSLADHVRAVYVGLSHSLPQARAKLALIVGRDVRSLDVSGICRAALESLAENTSDGVVAPLFFYILFGLPGIAIYKAINTADSMIGHKNSRYLYFGWAAARLDDVVNYIPARISGVLFAVAATQFTITASKRAFVAMWQTAHLHQSPNAGYPEAAMAGALDLHFGGPRSYKNEHINLPWLGYPVGDNLSASAANTAPPTHAPTAHHVWQGLKLYHCLLNLLFSFALILAVASSAWLGPL